MGECGGEKSKHKKAQKRAQQRALTLPVATTCTYPTYRPTDLPTYRPENDVGVVEHAFLEGDHDELGLREVGFEHLADVLRVRQVLDVIR